MPPWFPMVIFSKNETVSFGYAVKAKFRKDLLLHISNQLCNKLTILNITPAQLTDLMVSGDAGVFLVYISATADKS